MAVEGFERFRTLTQYVQNKTKFSEIAQVLGKFIISLAHKVLHHKGCTAVNSLYVHGRIDYFLVIW